MTGGSSASCVSLSVEGPTPEAPSIGDGGGAGEPARSLLLQGELADAYVGRVASAVSAARLNAFFPPTAPLRAHLGFLGPGGSEGLYPALRLSPCSGLPAAREVLRVKIDRDLAAGFVAELAGRSAPLPPQSKLARRLSYYRRLLATAVMPINRMTVELRQQLPQQQLALFRVVFDRFDLASEQFVRYTILLRQRDRFWQRRQLVLERDLAAATEGFRRIVGRFAADEAELCLVLLSQVEGIEVEDVRRCRVGPLLLPGARVGAALEALLDPERGPCATAPAAAAPWILCFPEDRAGREVSEHASGDPLAMLLREALGEEARALVDAKAEQLGYRVAKTRKFVCPEPLQQPLQQLCREAGAPSIVRPLRAGS